MCFLLWYVSFASFCYNEFVLIILLHILPGEAKIMLLLLARFLAYEVCFPKDERNVVSSCGSKAFKMFASSMFTL
jgi:hypothetical protein